MSTGAAAGRRYAGKTSAERQAERRERLLDAGLELFGTQGYAATTVEMVCAAARLNPRYFYESFENREALLAAVYDRHIESVTAAVVTAVAGAGSDPRDLLAAGLSAFLAAVLADERAARINYFEIVGVSPELQQRRRAVLRRYVELIAPRIEEAARSRRMPIRDPWLAAVGLAGAIDGMVIDRLSGDEAIDQEAFVASVLAVIEPILRVDESGGGA